MQVFAEAQQFFTILNVSYFLIRSLVLLVSLNRKKYQMYIVCKCERIHLVFNMTKQAHAITLFFTIINYHFLLAYLCFEETELHFMTDEINYDPSTKIIIFAQWQRVYTKFKLHSASKTVLIKTSLFTISCTTTHKSPLTQRNLLSAYSPASRTLLISSL